METDALRRRAEREGRSMPDVAGEVIRAYIETLSRRELLEEVLEEEIPRSGRRLIGSVSDLPDPGGDPAR